ncbi:hypothetical protein CRUP_015374 [Coryphaenoides rupestris]|nr:hypothetical protein CRUP_015374 [Coryphaenoides rupestris]
MAYQTLQQEYLQIPVVTRAYTTACVLTTAAVVWRYRYCRMLEEGSFRGRTADFVFMFLFGGLLMTIFGIFVSLVFLGQAFTIMLVYVWSRRIAVGHVYFFLEDVFPNQPGGGRKMIFDTPEEDANYNPLPEERPGGFAWGQGQQLGG